MTLPRRTRPRGECPGLPNPCPFPGTPAPGAVLGSSLSPGTALAFGAEAPLSRFPARAGVRCRLPQRGAPCPASPAPERPGHGGVCDCGAGGTPRAMPLPAVLAAGGRGMRYRR